MKKILEISNLCKTYHTDEAEIEALKNISFDVHEGEFISIVGPSGCGKSTILSILANLIDKSDGNVSILNNYKISYMLQDDSILPFLSVLDNCLFGLKIKKNISMDNKKDVLELLNSYGLGDFKDKYPNNLSGGMRQRCALIRTLALKPDILLLDEAMSALDYQTRLNIEDDIYRILKKEGKTVIMVTHDISEAISMSDRVIVLTNRPAEVKNIYEINLSNPSTPINNRKDKNFPKYFELIWEDLNE